LRVSNALINVYARSGSIDNAESVFKRMEKRDLVTWNSMIGGFAQHGCAQEALELFRRMNVELVKPDGTTFVAVLSACCHGGLVDDGWRLYSAMKQDYGIEPHIKHFTCMVDLLGRAGHLEEAKRFISDMPLEPNAVTWKALLGACRTYGEVELGEVAAKELLKLDPNDSSAYMLLANIYAAAGRSDEVSLVRSMMHKGGVRKEPGRSWIQVDNKVHEFIAGDTSHLERKAIYNELDKLTHKLKGEGYIPKTQLVMQNVKEEEKELALFCHSEKLAIAYGLMRVPLGEPIRVTKDLRVCPDCHAATKLISKVTGREIIARDASRFHHFKDGVCSCGDHW
jgi:pentatricopeptide repeat protein